MAGHAQTGFEPQAVLNTIQFSSRGSRNQAGMITYGRKRARSEQRKHTKFDVLQDAPPSYTSPSRPISAQVSTQLQAVGFNDDAMKTPRPKKKFKASAGLHSQEPTLKIAQIAYPSIVSSNVTPIAGPTDSTLKNSPPSDKTMLVLSPARHINDASSPDKILERQSMITSSSQFNENLPTPLGRGGPLASPFHIRPLSSKRFSSKGTKISSIHVNSFSRRTSAGPHPISGSSSFRRRPSGSHALQNSRNQSWLLPTPSPQQGKALAGDSFFFDPPAASSTPRANHSARGNSGIGSGTMRPLFSNLPVMDETMQNLQAHTDVQIPMPETPPIRSRIWEETPVHSTPKRPKDSILSTFALPSKDSILDSTIPDNLAYITISPVSEKGELHDIFQMMGLDEDQPRTPPLFKDTHMKDSDQGLGFTPANEYGPPSECEAGSPGKEISKVMSSRKHADDGPTAETPKPLPNNTNRMKPLPVTKPDSSYRDNILSSKPAPTIRMRIGNSPLKPCADEEIDELLLLPGRRERR